MSCRVLYMSPPVHFLRPLTSKQVAQQLNDRSISLSYRKLLNQSIHTNRRLYERQFLSNNEIKKDFFQWFKREAKILTALAIVGTIGVYFYKDREQAEQP